VDFAPAGDGPMVDDMPPAPGALPVTKRALVFWIAGAAGSGGSAVAARVRARLRDDGIEVLVLDDSGLRPAALAGLCIAGRARYHAILVAMVTPSAVDCAAARAALAPGFYQVDCAAGCGDRPIARPDVGRDRPPASPDLHIDTGAGRYALATARLLTFVRARLARHPASAGGVGVVGRASATLTLRGAAE
jgi:hypothetical protein